MTRETFSGGARTLMVGRFAGFAIAFVIPMLLVRWLDQEAFGTYKYLFMIAGSLGVLQLGLAESLYYFLPRDAAASGRLLTNVLLSLGVIGSVVAAGIAAFVPIATGVERGALGQYSTPFALYVGLTLVALPLEVAMIARHQYRRAAVTYASSDLVRAGLLVAPAVATAQLGPVLWGAAGFAGLRVAAVVAYARHEFGDTLAWDRRLWLRQLAYALPFSLAVFIETVQTNLHQFVVWARFDPATFAIYAAGCLQIPAVDVITTSVANVMMVRMAREPAEKGRGLQLWHEAVERLAFVLWPLTIALVLTARPLIAAVFTASYADAVPVFVVSTALITLAVFPVDAVLRVFACTGFLIVMNVVRLAVVASGIAWALGAFHLPGAMGVTVAGMLVAKAAATYRITRLLDASIARVLPWRALARIAMLSLLAAVPARLLAAHTSGMPPLLEGAAIAIVYGATYLAATALVASLGRRTAWKEQPAEVPVER